MRDRHRTVITRLFDEVLDAVTFGLSLAASHTNRAVRLWRRRRALGGYLRRFPPVTGRLDLVRPVRCPLSGKDVAGFRLLIEEQHDDGTWSVLRDDTRLGELWLRGPQGSARLAGEALLLCPVTARTGGAVVRRLLEGDLPLPAAEDLRGTVHHLTADASIHVFGLCEVASPTRGSPYRSTSDSTLDRDPAARLLLISLWPEALLREQVWQRPDLMPSALAARPPLGHARRR